MLWPSWKEIYSKTWCTFFKDQTIEDVEKVKESNTQINGGLIDFDPTSTTKYATYGDASQQDEGREDVDEPVIIDNRVEANQDVILPLIGIEPREQTSLQEVVNNQTWWSTRERQPSMRYPSLIYEGQPISFMMF